MSLLEVDGLSRRFGARLAVDDVRFSIERGELFALLGPNGAGKTTLVRMLCGTYAPSSGSAQLLGLDLVRSREAIRRRIGYLPQAFALYPALSVRENLRFYAGVYGVREAGRVDELCAQDWLARIADARVATLPTGQRQRAALAVAMVHDPELLFLDEPTSGVDPAGRRWFWQRLRALAARGVGALITTHVMSEASRCDRVGLMSAGRLVAVGTSEELVARAGLRILRVDAQPWTVAYERLKARWPATSLRQTTPHVPIAHAEELAEVRALLGDLDLCALSEVPASFEDAFVAYVERDEVGAAARRRR